MYDLRKYDSLLSETPFDISNKLAYRMAGRSFGLLSIIEERSVALRGNYNELFYLDFFRALILMSDAINEHSPTKIKRCSDYGDYLKSYKSKTHFAIAFRSALAAQLPNSRAQNKENLRTCMQSVLDNSRNLAYYLGGNLREIDDDIQSDFASHIATLSSGKPNVPPITKNSPFYSAWARTARYLNQKSDTWRIWIEWYDFRFLMKSGENVPSFLWREIEAKLCAHEAFLNGRDAIAVNAAFAKICLESLEKLVDTQAKLPPVPAGIDFDIRDDSIEIRQFDAIGSKNEEIRKTAIGEVIYSANVMLDHCENNSARHLDPVIRRYRDAFPNNESWSDDIELVMRGDAVRKAFESQLNKSYDSDLPDLSDEVMLSFRNLLRSHNTLLSLHENLWKIDEIVSASSSLKSDQAYDGLMSIVQFSETREYLNENSKKAIIMIAQGGIQDEARSQLLRRSSLFNFIRSASSWIWLRKREIAGTSATVAGLSYAVGSWMLANQQWLLETFPIDSSIGALIRAVLEILSRLPLA